MEPKEYAEELYAKYYNRIEHCLSEEVSGFEKDIVKHLALIAVEEILSYADSCDYDTIEFLEEVKKEIEKL